jgi:OOP family OmpA-OmpF porin
VYLPIQHVVADEVIAQDSALVSSMLTAIQDFAQDSFGTAEGETLATMQVGELLVWIEQGPEAILAAVIRGTPAPELRVVLQDVIETIHLRFNPELEAFDGDPDPLIVTRPLLENALLAQYREKQENKRRLSPAWALIIVAALLFGFWAFTSIRSYLRWEKYIALLDAEPGIVVTEQGRDDGRWNVKGLRDPLARDPRCHARTDALVV